MATAGDQINRALRMLGVLAEGESPTASTSSDALVALNQMIDSWNTERLSVYGTLDQSFTWPAATSSRTLGVGGNFVGTRPVWVDAATNAVVDGITYPLQLLNREQYNAIPDKTLTSQIPYGLYVNMTVTTVTMYIYPVPTEDFTIHIVSATPLVEPASIATTLVLPPGYLEAFTFNLALSLAAEFGVSPSKDVRRIASTSKRNIKRVNNPNDVMSMPGHLLGNQYGGNIYSGWY